MDEFACLLLEELAETETPTKVVRAVEGVGRRLTDLFRPIIGEGSPLERAERLSAFLRERGILTDTGRSKGMLTLSVYACPYVGLAGKYGGICAMHRKTVADLLGEGTRFHRGRSDGHPCCEFHVKIPLSKSASPSRKRPRPARSKRAAKRRD